MARNGKNYTFGIDTVPPSGLISDYTALVACPAHFKANKINTFLNNYSIESFNLPIFISNSSVLCYYAQSYFSRCFLKKVVTINPQDTSTMFPNLQIQPINLQEEEQ